MDSTGDLAAFIAASPTPWHAARTAADALLGAGFAEVAPDGTGFAAAANRGLVVRDGSLVAWVADHGPATPMRLIGAHTDSPGLRVRPRPDLVTAGVRQLAVEVYGGALTNSWLDRDLTLAGRVALRPASGSGPATMALFHHGEPLLRVPQLAIHLDRAVSTDGLRLDPQKHLAPVWGLAFDGAPGFAEWIATQVGAAPHDVLAWDVACVDTLPPARLGAAGELLAAPRLDDLACCFGAVQALLVAASQGAPRPVVVVLNDHEEVGSTSATGAVGAWAANVLERWTLARGGTRADLLSALAGSELASADMAHATHPNYVERHEPNHHIALGGGVVVKHNVNQRYASDARSAAAFVRACETAGVPVQHYSHRGDIPCGSTIGPLTAAALAVDTVDVGVPQLSMHSARELMACADVDHMLGAFSAWFTGADH